MTGAIPPLPNTPSWRGAQLKHRDNFILYHYHQQRRRRRRQGLCLMACSDSEFNFSEFMNLWTFATTPWTGNQPDAKRLPTQDNTIYPYPERDSNTRPQFSSGRRRYVP
jgi:hypothetical protein